MPHNSETRQVPPPEARQAPPANSDGPRDWRSALAALDPQAARGPVTLRAAQILSSRNLNLDAAAALKEFVGRYPEHHNAMYMLGLLLRRIGCREEATEVLVRAARFAAGRLPLAPGDRQDVVEFYSAADQCAPLPAKAPDAYVAALFDGFAEDFDSHLRGRLEYRAPELLLEALTRTAGPLERGLDVLDLGCGTGLAGELLRPFAGRLEGVDLSPKMLAKAADKGVYDRLITGDLVACLNEAEACYDLVIAADVFVYVGDLAQVFVATQRALRAGGWFAFTVEAADGEGYHLKPLRRYAHTRSYLEQAARAAGFAVRGLEEASTRIESLSPVRSFVCILAKPDMIETSAAF